MGTDPGKAERVLKNIFDRATRWDAVLLLDEADLFLTKRTTDDMQRNAFVTIFLRCLEYYQGIMFLTSNRIEEFDAAFHSRIHLSIKFDSPSAATRSKIWRNFLATHNRKGTLTQENFDHLGTDLAINGREIKNLISTGLAIAAYKKQPLSEDILRLVYSLNFGKDSTGASA